ncbi:hypothetical protein MATL_G00012900 [Megalops atlanticus]|uniref:Uncharacterized protein n=1 Tax=Megalops atlanticus TaxID=7932 RepID=A0A9D3TJU4_MEGAT|nr:hypothetical protein MATL_G00012900 [Megalops atlanticus]
MVSAAGVPSGDSKNMEEKAEAKAVACDEESPTAEKVKQRKNLSIEAIRGFAHIRTAGTFHLFTAYYGSLEECAFPFARPRLAQPCPTASSQARPGHSFIPIPAHSSVPHFQPSLPV